MDPMVPRFSPTWRSTIIDAHPTLLGIGIDEKAAIVVTGDHFQVIGKGRVAIYDNQKHGNNWYYWLNTGDVFNLRTRSREMPQRSTKSSQ